MKKRILDKDFSCVLTGIDLKTKTETFFLLVDIRNEEGVASEFFVGKLNCETDEIDDIVSITKNEHDFYRRCLSLKMSGFSAKKYQWSYFDIELEELKKRDYSLPKLWKQYQS